MIAQLHDGRCDGTEFTRSGVTSRGSFDGRDLPTEDIDRGVEVLPIEVAAALLGAALSVENFGHGPRLHHREGRAGLDGHVHPAMFSKLMSQRCQRL
ncbi:MAG: hypothetical protein EXS14_06295 [Planctomycetes bacterium]|nr:hypothetical protein [Planctomycetota bacterium]